MSGEEKPTELGLLTSGDQEGAENEGHRPVSAREIAERWGMSVPRRRRRPRARIATWGSLTGVAAIGGALAVALVSGPVGVSNTANASTQGGSPQTLSALSIEGGRNGSADGTVRSGSSGQSGVDSDKSSNQIGGLPQARSQEEAASRSITRSVLPGCSGERPRGTAPNGELPDSWLCSIGIGQHKLRADAAVAFAKMNAAYKAETGKDMEITDSYRSLESQISVRARKPGLAAVPGSSQHGWGLAIDFGGGAATASGPQYDWLVKHGAEYGWENPAWAKSSKYEPWHWEYVRGEGRATSSSD